MSIVISSSLASSLSVIANKRVAISASREFCSIAQQSVPINSPRHDNGSRLDIRREWRMASSNRFKGSPFPIPN
ncbi:MAG: hypothetical protein U7123_13930 [Potamolinea sp.]